MEQKMPFFIMAVLLIALGTPRLFFPERIFYFFEGLRYAYPLEPSPFRLRAIRTSGLLYAGLGLGLAWMGIVQETTVSALWEGMRHTFSF